MAAPMEGASCDTSRPDIAAGSTALSDAALRLLAGEAPSPALARAAGARDVRALEAALRRKLSATPAMLAGLGAKHRYTLDYGGPFHVAQTLRYLGRDADNLAERVEEDVYRRYFPLDGRQVPISLALREDGCRVELGAALVPAEKLALHLRLVRFLGLDQPLAGFYREVRRDRVMAPIARGLRGVRIPQVPSLWEALCWAVIGQQINLAFAYRLRNRFIALGNGARPPFRPPYPFPTPAQTLAIPAPAWREAQFSRQKGEYLTGLAGAFAEGRLSEQALLEAPQETAERELLAVRGLGPWSVAYALLRALGRVDALPVGDAGLRTALRHHFGLPGPPDTRRQEELMEPYRPYRGLATYYFWKSLDKIRQE